MFIRTISYCEVTYNKRFKRDNQRVAFLLCVNLCGYGVMRKVGSSVGCPLTGRYALLSLSKINI
ncbi:DUF3265 domain-containing protein [bacterium 19MO04SH03]|uniref:DUF3265 domain-containing protein n=3 Tax=Unclassified Bacteria TaxID=49928 RepID=A0AAU6TQY2_UNCXX